MKELEKTREEPKIAYFSMEIGLLNDIPTYSGGLGVLAGDTIKSAADLNLPMVAVTMLSRKGYFKQEITQEGRQLEEEVIWNPSDFMTLMPYKITVTIEGREVFVQAWRYTVKSLAGGKIPVFFLDTDIPENSPDDRGITNQLYGGDSRMRLMQEIVLGIGGVRILKALGINIKKYHMNEGHSSFLTLELLHDFKHDIEHVWDERLIWNTSKVRELCVFTTHTPVEAGHDKFDYPLVEKVLGDFISMDLLKNLAGRENLNMTLLALNLSKFINGVAKKHSEVSQNLFPGYEINAITNGVHSFTWTSKHMAKVFDKYIPGWANEPELLVRASIIPDDEIWASHQDAKDELLKHVEETTGFTMDKDILTIGFARRATAYKRATLLFSDIKRLAKIGNGKLQIIYAGKAHPKDATGKDLIERIIKLGDELTGSIKVVYLKNYNMSLASKLVSGVDVWLNTPLRPHEASGTSGMKASHNGVINFSVLDGWWIEGHIEDVTGWAIGPAPLESTLIHNTDEEDAEDLYGKLEKVVIPTYYENRAKWIGIMKNTISKNACYFNTHRMMRRYVTEAYLR